MTMKRRIFISNTAMVLISLLILFGIGGVYVLLFKEEIMNIIEQNAELSEDTYQVETQLIKQQNTPDTWEKLSNSLSEYSFHLYVSDSSRDEVYSNVKHSEMECIEELDKGSYKSDKIKLYNMENITIARCNVTYQGADYSVYASFCPKQRTFLGMDRGVFEMFIIVFIIAGIIVIAGLLLCCQLFTRSMIKRLMKPVDELNRAAIRINEGNLEKNICYEEEDEFAEVCDTFNKMQKHLKEGMEQNEKYEKARTEMISGISHDLRTPLTSVKGFIKGMMDGVANTPKKQEQYLKISYQKACDMEELLQKLFFISKLETGNMPFFTTETNINNWIENYVGEKEAESLENHYRISCDILEEECLVMMDGEQMKRVFNNLIENSRKYAMAEELKMSIFVECMDERVNIFFSDNGGGIEEDKLPHVFEQFYRGDESRNSKNEGSGLGLYVCKYIVEEQGGSIEAYNKDGFVVKIVLPRVQGGRNVEDTDS